MHESQLDVCMHMHAPIESYRAKDNEGPALDYLCNWSTLKLLGVPGQCVSTLGMDFSKSFNRIDHHH